MMTIGRRDFLVHLAAGVGLVAVGSPLRSLLEDRACDASRRGIRWLLLHPEGEESRARTKRTIHAMVKAPEGVKLVMTEYGTRFDEETQQTNCLVTIEAKAEGPVSQEVAHSLEQLGFVPYQEFTLSRLKSHLRKLAAEGKLVL